MLSRSPPGGGSHWSSSLRILNSSFFLLLGAFVAGWLASRMSMSIHQQGCPAAAPCTGAHAAAMDPMMRAPVHADTGLQSRKEPVNRKVNAPVDDDDEPPKPATKPNAGAAAAAPSPAAAGAEPSPASKAVVNIPPATFSRGAPMPAPHGGGRSSSGVWEKLRRWGFHPATIIDVGANQGAWSAELWREFSGLDGKPSPNMLMIEGAEARRADLNPTGFLYAITLVGPENRMNNWFESDKWHTGNSVLQENTNAFTGVAPKQVPMRRIDDIIAVAEEQHGISPLGPALLKLDVQGFEIQALKGAHRVLKSVEVVILESSVVEYNAGAPLTAELLGFVDSLGFQVLDVTELHPMGPENVLGQIDFAFVRKGSAMLRAVERGAGLTRNS